MLPINSFSKKDVKYWRNEIFLDIITFIVPISTIALVPSIYMSFLNRVPEVGFADILAFSLILIIMLNRKMSIEFRKSIFLIVVFLLAIMLLYYLSKPGPGLLFLLVITVFSSVLYSSSVAFRIAWANTLVCFIFGLLIYFKVAIPFTSVYTLGEWIAISSNLVFLSFVCVKSLNLLVNGLESSLKDSNSSEANLISIIENTDAYIYSLDTSFRYITYNQKLKSSIKQAYNVEIKPGDLVYGFIEKSSSTEGVFWFNIYNRALSGESVSFEKDFIFEDIHTTTSFSITPIIENNKVIGLSCYALDITERKKIELEKEKIAMDLIQRNRNLEQFTFIISHNLRAPAANIMGCLELIENDSLSPKEIKVVLNDLAISVYKLDDVIKDINTILNNKHEISEQKELINFTDLVNTIFTSLDSSINKNGISLSLDFDEIDEIYSIKAIIQSIFFNLIINSITYRNPELPLVLEIKSYREDKKIILIFKDNGLGIDLDKNGEKVFGLYQRFHTHIMGKGMGLYMVKSQLESIGGRISLRSKPNVGSEFTLEFNVEK